MDGKNIVQAQVKNFDIDWDNVKTIKDIKVILSLLVSEVVVDMNNDDDVSVYNGLKNYLK